MPLIMPDNRKRGGSMHEMMMNSSQMRKEEYAGTPKFEDLQKEAKMIAAKSLAAAIKEGNPESIIQAFKQMFDLCEYED